MPLSPILASHDADSLALDLGIFIAHQAKEYRTSPAAVRAAVVAALATENTPSQRPSQAPAAAASAAQEADAQSDGGGEDSSVATPPSDDIKGPISPAKSQSKTEIVLAVHRQNPTWPAKVIATEIGMSRGCVSGILSAAGVSVPTQNEYLAKYGHESLPARSQKELRNTKRSQLQKAHKEHPDWTSRDMAGHLSITVEHASTIANQVGIILPTARAPSIVKLARKKQVIADLSAAVEKARPVITSLPVPAPVTAVPSTLPPSKHERQFTGRQDMVEHYKGVGSRLGK